jgi:hypothetical protein
VPEPPRDDGEAAEELSDLEERDEGAEVAELGRGPHGYLDGAEAGGDSRREGEREGRGPPGADTAGVHRSSSSHGLALVARRR